MLKTCPYIPPSPPPRTGEGLGRGPLRLDPPLLDVPEVAVLDVRERPGSDALELLVDEQQRVGGEPEVVRLVLAQLGVEILVCCQPRVLATGGPARLDGPVHHLVLVADLVLPGLDLAGVP